MYRLMIVEDEINIRNGLAYGIDWNALGYEVAAVLENGKEALEFLQQNTVDVILSDINMTFVNGIELAEYVSQNFPEINIIFLSGYEEFEYAQKAVEYGVYKYLIKPVSMDRLEEVFKELAHNSNKQNAYGDAVYELRCQILTETLNGGVVDDALRGKFIKYGMEGYLSDFECCGVVLTIPPDWDLTWSYDKDALFTAIGNILPRSFAGMDIYSIYQYGLKYIIILICENLEDKPEQYVEYISKNISELLELNISYRLTGRFTGIEELISQDSSFLIFCNNEALEDKEISEAESILVSYIQDGNYKKAQETLSSMIYSLSKMDLSVAKSFIIQMTEVFESNFQSIGIPLMKELFHNGIYYDRLITQTDVTDVLKWGNDFIEKVSVYMEQYRYSYGNSVVNRVKEYIDNNYQNNLSLDEIASQVNFSSAYLSRFFKRQTDETITDYIIKTRMKQAMKLLVETDYKTYEISDMVGYKKSQYFSKTFKMWTGMTPSEYRGKS